MTTIIADDDVKRLLPMAECIEAMRVAFRDFANGIAVNRPRMRVIREDQVHELGDILIGKVAIAQPRAASRARP